MGFILENLHLINTFWFLEVMVSFEWLPTIFLILPSKILQKLIYGFWIGSGLSLLEMWTHCIVLCTWDIPTEAI